MTTERRITNERPKLTYRLNSLNYVQSRDKSSIVRVSPDERIYRALPMGEDCVQGTQIDECSGVGRFIFLRGGLGFKLFLPVSRASGMGLCNIGGLWT